MPRHPRLTIISNLHLPVLAAGLIVAVFALHSLRQRSVLQTHYSHIHLAETEDDSNARSLQAVSLADEDELFLQRLQPQQNSAAAGGNTPHSLLSKSIHLLKGNYETVDGAEVVWQAPPLAGSSGNSSSGGGGVRGVVFIAHGCGHSAIDWWPQSESCPKCIGLPEEMNVTLHLLLRGYVAVAVSSADRTRSRCWQNPWMGAGGDWDYSMGPAPVDWMQVKRVLDTLLPREKLQPLAEVGQGPGVAAETAAPSLPRYALGGSSGGGFILGLPLVFPPGYWSGLIVQIAAAPSGLIKAYREATAQIKPAPVVASTSTARIASSSSAWPPTLFVHMPRDTWLGGAVAANVAELRAEGVPVHEIRVLPQPLTPLYLAQRCAPEIDEPTSRAIFEAFRASGYIDGRGYLRHNPRNLPSWRQLLLGGGGGGGGGAGGVPGAERLRLRPEASPLAEALNHLYAGHELSSEPTTACLDWLEVRQ